jgi:CRISPR-associated endonuclease/helicase Cas3
MPTYYARENQTLSDHLIETANLAKIFADSFGVKYTAYWAAMLHDLGKYTDAFQDYLKRNIAGENVTRGEVIHALQGARYVDDTISDQIISDIIGNVIASHHGGLFDTITDGKRTISIKTSKGEDKLHYLEAVGAFSPDIDEDILKTEIVEFCQTSQERSLNPRFMLHLLTKAIYSCVVDADRCNSAGLRFDDTLPGWEEFVLQFETYLTKFSQKSEIDRIRRRISDQCKNKGSGQEPGIYTLSVPTGGGKTLSSLRFALEHASKHNMKRIIYVIPYLSIIDQTATKIRDIFTDDSGDLILEHHSNIEVPEDEKQEEQYRLLSSRWDSPIILTTMVQFLETIYSNQASKLRKFHNMSEAVFIFDEIQALPIKCVHLFNGAINFLQTFGKSTILLCTATQPHLHKTERPVLLSDNPNIVALTPDETKNFERVCLEDKTQTPMDHEQIANLVKTQLEQDKSTLVILNTKGDARKVFDQCSFLECEKIFLTTDLCPAHRLDVLERLRKNLDPETRKLTLCVSTQLIEAGVDVSFNCVIRAQAGMDSIIQAAGRCNRNKENSSPQQVFVIDIKDEKLTYLLDIKEGKDVSSRVFRENQGVNLLDEAVVSQFYEYYFYDQKTNMDYNLTDQDTTIFNLLNDNSLATIAYQSRNNVMYTGLPCAFQSAAKAFSVIDAAQTGVIVPYGDALQIIKGYENCYEPKDKMRILKKLQKYTVSVYSHDLKQLESEGAVDKIDDTFYLLSPDYYDTSEQGLTREALFSLLDG